MRVRSVAGAAIVAGAAAVVMTGPGVFAAGGTPANKVVAAGDSLTEIDSGEEVTLLRAEMKTSKPTDLLIQTSLECTILSALTTSGHTAATNSASSTSDVRVWVTFDNKVVPIMAISEPPQDTPPAGTKAEDAATFCNRTYQRTVTDGEGENGATDTESDYIETKSAHAFNWVQMNAGSGSHVIEVKADFTEATTGTAVADALVGNRTLIVEPTKMANNAVIANTGTSDSGARSAKSTLTKKETAAVRRLLRKK